MKNNPAGSMLQSGLSKRLLSGGFPCEACESEIIRLKILFLYLVFFLVAALLICIGGLSVWVLWHHIADVAADVKKSNDYINSLFTFLSTVSITLVIEHVIIKKLN